MTKTIFSRAHVAMTGVALSALLALGGCVSPSAGKTSGLYASPIGNAPVTVNPTPYTQALMCMSDYARTRNIPVKRIAIGRILDYTGKEDLEGGRKLTQGASLMAISAFAKAGFPLVERFDTSVSELELKYANNKLISDGDDPYRKITAGQFVGSDYYVVGGLTELNYNIRSVGVDAFGGDNDATDPKGRINAKLYVMNVGIDLRVVNTRTLVVEDVISFQKQIIGREVGAGVFSFFDNNLIDVGAGERALEPLQLAVRALVERSVLQIASRLYGAPGPEVCADAFGGKGDPLEGVSANAWHSTRDDTMRKALSPVASKN